MLGHSKRNAKTPRQRKITRPLSDARTCRRKPTADRSGEPLAPQTPVAPVDRTLRSFSARTIWSASIWGRRRLKGVNVEVMP